MDRSMDRQHQKGEAERSIAMSYSISTLLTRNLQEVFGENDATRRRAAIDEIYIEDCVFYDPSKGAYQSRRSYANAETARLATNRSGTH
jgi:hypothetical protein